MPPRACYLVRTACGKVGYLRFDYSTSQLSILSRHQRVSSVCTLLHRALLTLWDSGWASKNSNNVGSRSVSTALYNSKHRETLDSVGMD
jgi:hypothetical protein